MKIRMCLASLFAIIFISCVAILHPLHSNAKISLPQETIMSNETSGNSFFISTNTTDSTLSFDTISELKDFTRDNDNIGTEVTFYAYVYTSINNKMYADGSYFILYLASDKKGSFPIYGVGIPDDLVIYEGDLIYYTGLFDGNSFNGNTWPTFRTTSISFEEPANEDDSFLTNEEAGEFADVNDPSGFVALRSGPGTNYNQICSIPNGDNVLVLSAKAKHTDIQSKDWVEASYFTNGEWYDGWVQKSQLNFLY